MNQNLRKKCLKGGEHSNRDIEALCLQQTCQSDRLLCFYCIHQKHENHQIVYLLEGLESPIEKLNVNSKIKNKQEHEKYIKKKIKKINHGWKNLYKIFAGYINKIQKNLSPQIQAIQESFDENSARKFAQVITNVNTTPETVEKYVDKIKLILKYDLSNITQIKVSTGIAYEDLKQVYATANKQISNIMEKILKQANLFSVLNCNLDQIGKKKQSKLGIDDRNRVNISIGKDKLTVNSYESRFEGGKGLCKRLENRYIEKRIQIFDSKRDILNAQSKHASAQKQLSDEYLSQRSQISKKANSFKSKNNPDQQNQTQNLVLQIKQPSDSKNEDLNTIGQHYFKTFFKENLKKQNQPVQRKFQNHLTEDRNQDQKFHDRKDNKIYQSIFSPQQNQKSENNQIQLSSRSQNNSQNFEPLSKHLEESSSEEDSGILRYRNFEYSESSNLSSPQIISLKQIYLNLGSLGQIQNYLNKIPAENYHCIRSLEIFCDTLPLAVNETIMEYILNFKYLKKLVICQANGMKKDHILEIVNNLSELEYLVLQQNYEIKDDLAELILKKLKKLKKFQYTSDHLEHMFLKEQNNQFMLEVDGSTKASTVSKITNLPHLQTIAFENIHKITQMKINLSKMKKISELSILYHSKQQKINPVLDMLSELNSTKHLLHLQLKQGYFKEDSLIDLINNCRALKSLGLNKCRDITNRTIQALSKHKKTLKQLDFMEQDELTGEGFQQFVQLQILSLKACWQIKEDSFGKNISQLSKLKCLNINYNRYWVTDNLFDHIQKLAQLQILEIDTNKVNYKGLFKLKNLTKLDTLVCGNTDLSGEDIIKFLSLSKSRILKLSLRRQFFEQKSLKNQIYNQPFEGKLLDEISKYAPQITHLNIKGMKKVAKFNLQNFANLKCLSTDADQLDEESFNWLKNKRISLYVGYSHFNYEIQIYKQPTQKNPYNPKDQAKIKLEQ